MGSERMVPNQATLLRFEDPSFTCTLEKKKKHDADDLNLVVTSRGVVITPEDYVNETNTLLALRNTGGSCPDPALFAKTELKEVLNILIPPKEWNDCGKNFEQQVSIEPALRIDVIRVNEQLNRRIASREAKEYGVCSVRRELYSQVFDELIREVSIVCSERGLLLLRMRDEIRMSIDAYRSIYESSKSFGSKREESIDAEDRDPNELEAKIAEIEGDKMNLQNLIQAMQDNMALKEIKHKELVDAETKKHNEEVEFLKKVHDQLEKQLELFTGPNPHIAKTGKFINSIIK